MPRLLQSVLCVALGALSVALMAQSVLEMADVAAVYFSRAWWSAAVMATGGKFEIAGQPVAATVPLPPLLLPLAGLAALAWLTGAAVIAKRCCRPYRVALADWGVRGWRWWSLPGLWFAFWLAGLVGGWTIVLRLLADTSELLLAVAAAGWLAEFVALVSGAGSTPQHRMDAARWRPLLCVLAVVVLYTVVFTAMNWGLWFNLRIPHGDSAMYEEHLWNLEHGKGFRSYLDQGLFLGEHIQVIHCLLIPIHLIWPSHLALELCQSLGLALGAIPVFTLARRHTQSPRAGIWLACAYLLYFPMQYLDIAIDLKTFRPSAFGIPLLLWAIDAMERRRFGQMALLFLVTLSAQEDFAIVIAPLGAWLALCGGSPATTPWLRRRTSWVGGVTAVLATVYLLFVVRVAIPWFRGGETVHYARYFQQFGNTPGEIMKNMLLHPQRLLAELCTVGSLVYALRLLVPLGGAPLCAPTRLAVGAPLFVTLCLNQLTQDNPAPVHHFHAPLIPILLWAAAAGLSRYGASGIETAGAKDTPRHFQRLLRWSERLRPAPAFVAGCALFTSITWSLGPLGLKFWDPGHDPAFTTYWRTLFVQGERARQFARVAPLIPMSARIASTDFVHPRFTHCERSYDYSHYPRAVANYEDRVPYDADFIVIDTHHPYSEIKSPAQVRELQREPDRWELLPDATDGYFIVLKRRDLPAMTPPAPPVAPAGPERR